MIDRKFIGMQLPDIESLVEADMLRDFALATGQTDPVFSDEEAARQAGYASLLAPPTFLVALASKAEDPQAFLRTMVVSYEKLLHAQQSFSYQALIVAGDTITMKSEIADIYEKKNGALEFIIQEQKAFNQNGQQVACATSTLVVQNEGRT